MINEILSGFLTLPHCSLSMQQPGKPGRHSVAQNHSLGKKLTGRTSARHRSMASSLGHWQFKSLNWKMYVLGTHIPGIFSVSCKWLMFSKGNYLKTKSLLIYLFSLNYLKNSRNKISYDLGSLFVFFCFVFNLKN